MKRSWKIEALRFIATMGIAIFHFEWIYIGHPVYFQHFYLWVEFFFVLSGFFLAKNCKEKKQSALNYTWQHVKKLWPQYIIAFVFSFVVYCFVNKISGHAVLGVLWKTKWEMIFFQLFGFDANAPVINGVTGYIPALLVGSLIIYYFLDKYYEITVNLFAPILPIMIYAHMINTYGNISQWMEYEDWCTIGCLRGIAGILIGVLAYEIGRKRMSGGGILHLRKGDL